MPSSKNYAIPSIALLLGVSLVSTRAYADSIGDLQQSISDARKDITQLTAQVKRLEADNNKLGDQNKKMQVQLQSLNSMKTSLANENVQLRNHLTILKRTTTVNDPCHSDSTLKELAGSPVTVKQKTGCVQSQFNSAPPQRR